MDLELAAPETRKIEADLANAKRTIGAWERTHGKPPLLTETQVRSAVAGTGDLVRLLGTADRCCEQPCTQPSGSLSATREKQQRGWNKSTPGQN